MRKVLLTLFFAGLALAVSNTTFAQGAKNRVGFFLAAETGDIDEIGIGALGEFRVAQKFSLSPQLILYFPGDDLHVLEFNFNGNYYFYSHEVFSFYGLGGLNFTRVSYNGPGDNDYDNNEIGLNLGGGINFEIGERFAPFSELRFTIGDYDQFVISAGLKFNLR
jgi:outer membrane immunogenic protein